MNDNEKLDTYNGNTIHDTNVDLDYNENTGDLPEYFDETNTDDTINNLNDWD